MLKGKGKGKNLTKTKYICLKKEQDTVTFANWKHNYQHFYILYICYQAVEIV